MKLPPVSPDDLHCGFRGSARFVGRQLVHAISKRDHHWTVCGQDIDFRADVWAMNTNGQMVVPNCLQCWALKDPFP